jgi:hypothetical protein
MSRSLVSLLGVCLLAGSPASLAAGPSVDASYSVQTMGVGVGSATLRLERMAEGLAAHFRFETAALLGLVEKTDTRMETVASGLRGALGLKRFVGVYQKEDRTREVDIAYGANGAIDAFALKKRGSVRISAVPAGLAEGTVDPIGAFLRARSWLDQATVGSELAMSVFDGRKRYDTTLRYLGLTQHGEAPAYQVGIRYELVQSLNEDSGVLEPEKKARPRELQMTVSADGRYVPLRVDGNFDGMPLTATLAADCAGPGGCPN